MGRLGLVLALLAACAAPAAAATASAGIGVVIEPAGSIAGPAAWRMGAPWPGEADTAVRLRIEADGQVLRLATGPAAPARPATPLAGVADEVVREFE